MNKNDFLGRLRAGLAGLPQDDVNERISFYSEMIDDRMEDGLTEEEAVAEIGPVEKIVSQIIADTPFPRIVREGMKTGRRRPAWEIVLLILGFPVWFPLLIAGFAVLLSLYVVLWSLVLSLWVVEFSFIVSCIACLAAGILFFCRSLTAAGLAAVAGSLVLAGLSVFLFFACRAAGRGAAVLTKKTAVGTKSLFLRKENANEAR